MSVNLNEFSMEISSVNASIAVINSASLSRKRVGVELIKLLKLFPMKMSETS